MSCCQVFIYEHAWYSFSGSHSLEEHAMCECKCNNESVEDETVPEKKWTEDQIESTQSSHFSWGMACGALLCFFAAVFLPIIVGWIAS
jgi:hypothetical protein